MSDFQTVAIFIFALLMLSTYILNQFFKWQMTHNHSQELNFDPEIKFEQLARKRIKVNNSIHNTAQLLKTKEENDNNNFTVYDTTSGEVYEYYKHKIDYKE